MSDPYAWIEIAPQDRYSYNNVKEGDLVFSLPNSNQSIHFGTSNATPGNSLLSIVSSNLVFNGDIALGNTIALNGLTITRRSDYSTPQNIIQNRLNVEGYDASSSSNIRFMLSNPQSLFNFNNSSNITIASITSNGIICATANSSNATPQYSWISDTTTGLALPTPGTLEVIASGSQVLTLSMAGTTLRNTTTASNILTSNVTAASSFIGASSDTLATPSYTWSNDLTTGFYHPSSSTISVTCGGIQSLDINASQPISYRGALWQPGGYTLRNRIINGDMRIDQRNVGSTLSISTSNIANQTYTVDRWFVRKSVNGTVDFRQVDLTGATALPGFTKALSITAISATPASLSNTDYLSINQAIEGSRTVDFNWCTTNASPVTVSFWVYSSLVATYTLSLANNANDLFYNTTFSITNVNTWTYVTKTIPGPTTSGAAGGTFPNSTSTRSLIVRIALVAGTNYTTPNQNTWEPSITNLWASSSQSNFMSVANTNILITGVQLEVGCGATPYERMPYLVTLDACQRYYEKSFFQETKPATNVLDGAIVAFFHSGTGRNGNYAVSTTIPFSAPKCYRNYSITFYNPEANNNNLRMVNSTVDYIPYTQYDSPNGTSSLSYNGFSVTLATGVVGNLMFHYTVDSELYT